MSKKDKNFDSQEVDLSICVAAYVIATVGLAGLGVGINAKLGYNESKNSLAELGQKIRSFNEYKNAVKKDRQKWFLKIDNQEVSKTDFDNYMLYIDSDEYVSKFVDDYMVVHPEECGLAIQELCVRYEDIYNKYKNIDEKTILTTMVVSAIDIVFMGNLAVCSNIKLAKKKKKNKDDKNKEDEPFDGYSEKQQ